MSNNTKLLYRVSLIIVHAAANFVIMSWLMNFDISGSWVGFFAFIFLYLILLSLFIMHLYSFFVFIKTKTI